MGIDHSFSSFRQRIHTLIFQETIHREPLFITLDRQMDLYPISCRYVAVMYYNHPSHQAARVHERGFQDIPNCALWEFIKLKGHCSSVIRDYQVIAAGPEQVEVLIVRVGRMGEASITPIVAGSTRTKVRRWLNWNVQSIGRTDGYRVEDKLNVGLCIRSVSVSASLN